MENFSSTTITVSWGPALSQDATGYNLAAIPIGGGQSDFDVVAIDRNDVTFNGLGSGTEYLISLTINGIVGSPTSINQYTRKCIHKP